MRLAGHSMTAGTNDGGATGANRSSPSLPPLEHPYGALALVLALSGSQRWAPVGEDKGQEVQEGEKLVGAGWTDDQGRERERSGEGLDTSRLWSTDSEKEEGGEDEDGEDGLSVAAMGSLRRQLSSSPGLEAAALQDGGESEGGTSAWIKAFESDGSASDGELSPHTDGQYERPPSSASERENPRAHWFMIDRSTTQGNHALIAVPCSRRTVFFVFMMGSARILNSCIYDTRV